MCGSVRPIDNPSRRRFPPAWICIHFFLLACATFPSRILALPYPASTSTGRTSTPPSLGENPFRRIPQQRFTQAGDDLKIAIITAQTKEQQLFAGQEEDPVEFLHLSADYSNLFIQNKKDWAAYQSYDYVHSVMENEPSSSPPTSSDLPAELLTPETVERSIQWVKIDLLQKYLAKYDWICWLDMDAIVVDPTVQLETYIRQALEHRPLTDLIMEGSEEYKKLDGTAVKSGVIIMRNSVWMQRLLTQVKEILADDEWTGVLDQAMFRRSSSSLDDAFVFLLSSNQYADSHIYFMNLQDRWNQRLVYLPKIGILHFSGCTVNDEQCLDVLNRALTHMLRKEQMYVYLFAPYIQHLYHIFVAVYVLFACDRAWHILGRYFWPSPLKKLPKVKLPEGEGLEILYPMVAVQLPMFNETSCCQTIIDSACKLDWPASRLFVQVVDDSTSEETKQLIDDRVRFWTLSGVQVEVRRRTNRSGFKAGAMNEAMAFFPPGTEYIAIFDADFLPGPNFLRQTVPYLIGDEHVGFVQTRWVYTNAKESLLTRMQEIALNFHFLCEQEVRFRTGMFFNFNGTAGVWRKAALDGSGGWHTDTLVEDMDLSLRAWALGWKFVFLKDVVCLNEIPPTFQAYRAQQHRWTSGPMQVLKKAFRTIYVSDKLSLPNKMFCIWFFLRNYIHLVNFLYFLVLIPLMIWIPRVTLYEWAVIYLPAAISMTNVFFTPSECLRILNYVLFENAMCLYKTGALICGVLNIGKAKQWIVTPKYARKSLQSSEELTFAASQEQKLEEKLDAFLSSGPLSSLFHQENKQLDGNRSAKKPPTASTGKTVEELQSIYAPKAEAAPSGAPFAISAEYNPSWRLPSPPPSPRPEHRSTCPIVSPETTTSSVTSPKQNRIIPLAMAFQQSAEALRPIFSPQPRELFMMVFLLVCAYFGFLMRQKGIASFALLNAGAYLVMGTGWLGRRY